MSKRRLMTTLAVVVACLALSAGLAVWSFPLKASAQDSTKGVSQDKTQETSKQADSTALPGGAGVIGGVPGGVIGGVSGGVVGSVTAGPKGGTVNGVPGGQVGPGVTGSVIGGPDEESMGSPAGSAIATDDSSGLKLIHRVEPEYPPLAKLARIQGDVSLEIHVNEKGDVFGVRALNGHPLLVKAAVDAVTQWHYAPPTKAPVTTTTTLSFRLDPNESAAQPDAASIEQLEAQLKALEQKRLELYQALASDQSQQQEAQVRMQLEQFEQLQLAKQAEASQSERAGEQYNQALRAQVEALEKQKNSQEMLLARLKLLQEQARGGLGEAGSGENALKLIHAVNPLYPEEARKLHVEGNVVLDATVNEKGEVIDLKVIDGPKLLVKAAIDAVRRWRYSPPPTAPVHTTVTIDFTLAEPDSPGKKSGTYKYKGALYSYGDKPNPAGDKPNPASEKDSSVRRPVPIYAPNPPYPKEAKEAHVQGVVVLMATVDADGKVSNVSVTKSLNKDLDKSALDTVRTWKFKPGLRDGKPVSVKTEIEIQFLLS